jgi:hypothetical protein
MGISLQGSLLDSQRVTFRPMVLRVTFVDLVRNPASSLSLATVALYRDVLELTMQIWQVVVVSVHFRKRCLCAECHYCHHLKGPCRNKRKKRSIVPRFFVHAICVRNDRIKTKTISMAAKHTHTPTTPKTHAWMHSSNAHTAGQRSFYCWPAAFPWVKNNIFTIDSRQRTLAHAYRTEAMCLTKSRLVPDACRILVGV